MTTGTRSPTVVSGVIVDQQVWLNASQLALWILKCGHPKLSDEIEAVAKRIRETAE